MVIVTGEKQKQIPAVHRGSYHLYYFVTTHLQWADKLHRETKMMQKNAAGVGKKWHKYIY